MNIKITHRNAKVSDSIRDKVESWLYSSQDRYEVITSAHVIMEKGDREDLAEASIHIAGKDIFAKASADNLYSALDALADKIDKQLDKVHQKHVNKKGAQRPVLQVEDDSLAEDDDLTMATA